MSNASASAYGLASYVETARQIGARDGANRHAVLARMLFAKALHGLSAVEYGLYGLQGKPFRCLGDYQTKKQTTALFDGINPAAARVQVDDKLRFHRLCVQQGLPVPPLHAILSRRDTPAQDDVPVWRGFAEVQGHFRETAEIRLILKPQNDSLGTGVRFVCLRAGEAFDIEDRPLPLADFVRELDDDMRRDDYLVQTFVRPHPAMMAFGSGKALGTLRVLALHRAGATALLYALMRIPCGANVHDNFSAGRSGNLIAAVDLASGRLRAAYGRRDEGFDRLLMRYDRNPDTGRPLAGEPVPEWAAIRALVERAAAGFASLPVLGWDIALSEDGVVIIEANANPDIIGAQVSTDHGARELMRALYR